MTNHQNTPFSLSYTPELPELMRKLNCALALTTYQAGKLAILYAPDDERLTVLPRTFEKPMGIAMKDNKMAVACKNEVIILQNAPGLAVNYPKKPGFYDAFYAPKSTLYTGFVDIHDIAFGSNNELWGVNTSFSCLCRLDTDYHFEPVWKPSFISELQSEDRCHLNGLAMQDGQPKYVTALSTTNTPQGWRENIVDGGVIMDVTNDQILVEGLAMPHSPRIYNEELYFVLSATGQLVKLDLQNKTLTVIKEFEGFCRGLDIVGDYAFVGMSKLRKNSSTFAKLPFAEKADQAGIKVIYLPTGALVGELIFNMSVDEIYEVKVMEGMLRPNVLNTQNEAYKYALNIPGNSLWANPEAIANSKTSQ